MAKTTKTETMYTCDLCRRECASDDGCIEIQVSNGDGRDVGPGFIRGRLAVFLPYVADNGELCKPCLLKWLGKYVAQQGMA